MRLARVKIAAAVAAADVAGKRRRRVSRQSRLEPGPRILRDRVFSSMRRAAAETGRSRCRAIRPALSGVDDGGAPRRAGTFVRLERRRKGSGVGRCRLPAGML